MAEERAGGRGAAGPAGDDLSRASDETLLVLRDNLLAGLDLVAGALAAGTFDVSPKHGQAPPRESGCLTLAVLISVNNVLYERGYGTIFVEG